MPTKCVEISRNEAQRQRVRAVSARVPRRCGGTLRPVWVTNVLFLSSRWRLHINKYAGQRMMKFWAIFSLSFAFFLVEIEEERTDFV